MTALSPETRSGRRRRRAKNAAPSMRARSHRLDPQPTLADRLRALAHQRRIGVVMLAGQVQERFDIDVVEFHFTDFFLGGGTARRAQYNVVEAPALVGLKVLARRNRDGIDLACMIIVEDEPQGLELMAQNVD